MTKLRTVYLAGAMENVSQHNAQHWREIATKELDNWAETLNPCRRIHSLRKEMRSIFELDIRDINESDVILVNLNNPEIPKNGTAMEVFYASYIKRIPVVAFKSDPATIHPFFESLVTEWRSDVYKACDTLRSKYL